MTTKKLLKYSAFVITPYILASFILITLSILISLGEANSSVEIGVQPNAYSVIGFALGSYIGFLILLSLILIPYYIILIIIWIVRRNRNHNS